METTTPRKNFNNVRVDHKVLYFIRVRALAEAGEIASYWEIPAASVKRSLARLEAAGKVFLSYDVNAWRVVQ